MQTMCAFFLLQIQNIMPHEAAFVAPQMAVKSIAKWLGSLSSAASAQPPGGRGESWRVIASMWGLATGCRFRIWEEKWLQKYCTTVWIRCEVWTLLILALVPAYAPSHRLCGVCLFCPTVHSGTKDIWQHHSRGLPSPLGPQARHIWEKICPAESWGQLLNCSFMALRPNECLSQPCKSGLSFLNCGHFCIILTAKIKAHDKTPYESMFLLRLSSHEKCVKSSAILGT